MVPQTVKRNAGNHTGPSVLVQGPQVFLPDQVHCLQNAVLWLQSQVWHTNRITKSSKPCSEFIARPFDRL